MNKMLTVPFFMLLIACCAFDFYFWELEKAALINFGLCMAVIINCLVEDYQRDRGIIS